MRKFFDKLMKIELVKHVGLWSSPAVLASLAKTMVIGVAVTKLSQEDFGYISMAMLIFSYGGYLQLGVTDALNLRLPEYYVKKRIDLMQQSLYVALRFVLCNLLIVAPLILLSTVLLGKSKECFIPFGAYIVSTFLYQIFLHLLLANRYIYKFKIASLARFSIAVVRVVIQIPVVIRYGINGFLLVEALLYLLPIAILVTYGKARFKGPYDRNVLVDLLKVGFPLVIISVAAIFSSTVDRWFVIYIGGPKGMATYSVAVYIGTIMLILPNQILSIFSQYTREMLAKGVDTVKVLDNYIILSVLVTVVLGVMGLVVEFVTVLLIPKYLPAYGNSLPLMPIIIIVIIFRSVVSNLNYYCVISDFKKYVLYSNLLGIGVVVTLDTGLVLFGGTVDLIRIMLVSFCAIFIQLLYIMYKCTFNVDVNMVVVRLLLFLVFLSSLCIVGFHYLFYTDNLMLFKYGFMMFMLLQVGCGILLLRYLYKAGFLNELLTVVKREY